MSTHVAMGTSPECPVFVFSNILRCLDNNTAQWSVGIQGRNMTYMSVDITLKGSVHKQGINMAYMPVNITVKESVGIQGINMAYMPENITMQQPDSRQCMYLTHMQMESVDKEETSIAHMPTNF